MRLTPDQVNELIRRLSQHGEINCPVCGTHQWNVNDLIIESREFVGGDLTLGGIIMPFIPLTCRNCGNTLFLNAVQLGFVNNNRNGEQSNTAATNTSAAANDNQ